MEVEASDAENSDIDNELLQKLNTLGTRDKEDLVAQFQSIVGNQMTRGCCSFYLDMGNWNLQTALGAYYDVMSSNESLPLFEVIQETQHTEEFSVQPSQSFLKSWRFRNIGGTPWPNNLKLKFVDGVNFGHGECAALPPLGPNETTDLSITMIAPYNEGYHEGHWRMITLSGVLCGAVLKVTVNVDTASVNSLTKQMSSLGQQQQHMLSVGGGAPTQPMSTPLRPVSNVTPFCSPTGYGIFGSGNVPSNGFNNGQLPIINEGTNISMDEQQLSERTARLLQDTNSDNSMSSEPFQHNPFNS